MEKTKENYLNITTWFPESPKSPEIISAACGVGREKSIVHCSFSNLKNIIERWIISITRFLPLSQYQGICCQDSRILWKTNKFDKRKVFAPFISVKGSIVPSALACLLVVSLYSVDYMYVMNINYKI